jgi:hypothetical protein
MNRRQFCRYSISSVLAAFIPLGNANETLISGNNAVGDAMKVSVTLLAIGDGAEDVLTELTRIVNRITYSQYLQLTIKALRSNGTQDGKVSPLRVGTTSLIENTEWLATHLPTTETLVIFGNLESATAREALPSVLEHASVYGVPTVAALLYTSLSATEDKAILPPSVARSISNARAGADVVVLVPIGNTAKVVAGQSARSLAAPAATLLLPNDRDRSYGGYSPK